MIEMLKDIQKVSGSVFVILGIALLSFNTLASLISFIGAGLIFLVSE